MTSVATYVNHLLSMGIYAVTLDSLLSSVNKSKPAIKQEVYRLIKKKKMVSLRRGFYLLVSPRYANAGYPPLRLYVDALFETIGQPYYLCLFTAARIHGAAHQAYQSSYIMTNKPLADIESTRIKFLVTTNWPVGNIEIRKGEAGYYKISDPVLTATDLVYHQSKVGGVNNILAFIEELLEEMLPQQIRDLLSWYPHQSTLRRLGFLMEKTGAEEELLAPLIEFVAKEESYSVSLTNDRRPARKQSAKNRWNVIENIKLESDLW